MDIVLYALLKNYVNTKVTESGVQGKSAYEIAQDNGFLGTEQEWLESLQGTSPHIGENGHWFIGDVDTGVSSSSSVELLALTKEEILEICK